MPLHSRFFFIRKSILWGLLIDKNKSHAKEVVSFIMNEEVRKRGYLNFEDIPYNVYPSKERMKKGPFPVIECIEKIPCNPCETGCARGAIKIGENIVNLPEINYDLCNSCALCVAKCPGLAIFMVDLRDEKYARLSIPWELLPLPKKGERFDGLNRKGEKICEGEIVAVRKMKEKAHIVTGQFPREFINEVRHFKILRGLIGDKYV